MKILRPLFFVMAILALTFSCRKEKSIEVGGVPAIPGDNWQFKDSALLFKGTMEGAFYDNAGLLNAVTLEGTSADKSGNIILKIKGLTPVANARYSSANVMFRYSVSGAELYKSNPDDSTNFSVSVQHLDSVYIEGTFAGKVKDAGGKDRTIKDGKFRATFKSNGGSAPPSAGKGQLMLWSKTSCKGDSIAVKIQNAQKSITAFQTAEPSCGISGTALFELAPGNYTWEAYCGKDTMRGSVGVSAGGCIKAEVSFDAETGTNCKLSEYTAYDISGRGFLYNVKSYFTNDKKVAKIELYDSAQSVVSKSFNLSHTAGKISIDGDQYFNVDPGTNVKEFYGYSDPMDPTSYKVVIKYIYTAGRLTGSTLALQTNPSVPIVQAVHTWEGGNLTRMVIQKTGAPERTQIDYEYDLTKQTKNYLLFFANRELQVFQTAINTGIKSANAVTKSTIREFNAAGTMLSMDVTNFKNYSINPFNSNVQSFEVTGTQSVYGGNAKYQLAYKCF